METKQTNKPQGDLILQKKWAEIKQVGKEEQENCIRLYCDQYPNGFNLQIRTFKPTNKFGEGVKRQMVASVGITLQELKQLVEYAEKESKKYD